MTKKPLISIIVPNYQGEKVFPNCIQSLLKQDYKNIQIVFVDDCSTDTSVALAKKLFGKEKRVTLVKTNKNSGFVGACNYALTFCKGEYVIPTNNDATFDKNWVSEMYKIVEGKKKVIGASLVLQKHHKKVFRECFNQDDNEKDISQSIAQGEIFTSTLLGVWGAERTLTKEECKHQMIEVSQGGIMILPIALVKKRIFQKEYFAYGEDHELSKRLRLQGYHIVVNLKAKMHHLGSYTKRVDKGFSFHAVFDGTKNKFRNFFVFYELKNTIVLFPWFVLMELLALVTKPKEIGTRLKAYWWVVTHIAVIRKHRKEIQKVRMLSDTEMFRLISYKIASSTNVDNKLIKGLINLCNAVLFIYCKITRIQTFDSNGLKDAQISLKSITPKRT